MSHNLLIIEDDPGLQSQMRWCFDDVNVAVAGDRAEAQDQLETFRPQVVTLDLGLPPDAGGTSEGEALLQHITGQYPHTKVIVITGREEREHAINAIANGAYDFYQKPIEAKTLQFAVERAFNLADLESANQQLATDRSSTNMPLPGMIATHKHMLALCDQVKRVARSELNVLITGETGTGKEIIANNIHALSDRSSAPLITINCAAIPENLLESELFGHEKGSFTGAHTRKVGKVEAAAGGTLFLDEIGDMPVALQAKILRFLQERKFERVGATQSIEADVRVISATHQKLPDMIGKGTFREDLFYRVSEVNLDLPPLRERGTDVLLIAEKILQDNQGGRQLRFSADALRMLEQNAWPGNIRELENKVRRAAIMAEHNVLQPQDLQLNAAEPDDRPMTLKEARSVAESKAIVVALMRTNANISEAARLLGVSRPTLYNLIDKYEINSESFHVNPA